MVTELRVRNVAQQLYVRALSTAWRNNIELHDPSLWLLREPELEEKMLRDADIAHAVGYRCNLVAGQRWACVPRVEGSPRAPMAVAVATELLDGIKNFTQARRNLSRAFFSGARFGYILGEPRRLRLGDGIERLWWVPVGIEDRDKRFYRIVPEHRDQNRELRAHWERWDIVATQFVTETVDEMAQTIRHVYQDDQASVGHGRGLREAAGWWWYAKAHVFEESLQAVERFAQGILTARIDGARDAETGLPNTELIRQWRAVLEDMRARHVLVYDKSDEIATVQMNASGWELLNTIREELRTTLTTLILGANVTTQASEGGSYALAAVQENSTEALVQFDRESLEETLTDDLLGCLWWKNHANLVELGIADEKPRFNISQEKRQDPKERADVAAVLNGMGVELSLEDVLDQTGFRKPEPGEQIIEKAAPPDPFGGSPFGGSPFGGPPQPGNTPPAGGAAGGGGLPTPAKNEPDLRPSPLPFRDQPRAPAGTSEGGQFLPKEGGSTTPTKEDDGHEEPKSKPKKDAPKSKPRAPERKATEEEAAALAEAKAARKVARASRAQTTPANPEGRDSYERHRTADGWTEERKAMHEEILSKVLAAVPSVDAPTVYFMGGGPASGKSSMIRVGAVKHPDLHVALDPDEFKADIPDYRDNVAAGNSRAAMDAHEESSELTKVAAARAAAASQDVVWDGTGDGSVESMLKRIKMFREKGYRVQADYATVPTDVAVERAMARAKKTGRLVPEGVIRKTHRSVSEVWPELAKQGAFDESTIFDTSTREPRKIASADRSGKITIHDPEAYEAFLAKANE